MKKTNLRLESVQIVLPEELPFEKGTGLSRQDACSRLMFQLLLERILPDFRFDEDWSEETSSDEDGSY